MSVVLRTSALLAATVLLLVGGLCVCADEKPARKARREVVQFARLLFDDGDTITIRAAAGAEEETVRILGIDTPEVQHLEHDLPHTQDFGREAAGFLRGCFMTADRIEILRSPETDPHGRTLAYFYVNGKNYSVLAIRARLAVETVTHYGDNGLPKPAAEVLAAAETAGPVAFEAPYLYRRRMRAVAKWLKEQGAYPTSAGR
jgi:hypothetical protein